MIDMKVASFFYSERVSGETSSVLFIYIGVFVLIGFHILCEGLTYICQILYERYKSEVT